MNLSQIETLKLLMSLSFLENGTLGPTMRKDLAEESTPMPH